MQPQHELQILGDRLGRKPTDCLDERTLEEAESSGNDRERIQAAPADPADEKRAEVFQNLKGRQPAPRQLLLHHEAVVDAAPVRDADGAARCDDDVGVVQDRLHDLEQGVLFEQRVRVDHAHVRVARRVDARVQRIGSTAVVLLDHAEIGHALRKVGPANGLVGNPFAQDAHDRDEVELVVQASHCPVGRSVVDDQHLVARVVQSEE